MARVWASLISVTSMSIIARHNKDLLKEGRKERRKKLMVMQSSCRLLLRIHKENLLPCFMFSGVPRGTWTSLAGLGVLVSIMEPPSSSYEVRAAKPTSIIRLHMHVSKAASSLSGISHPDVFVRMWNGCRERHTDQLGRTGFSSPSMASQCVARARMQNSESQIQEQFIIHPAR